MSDEFDPYYKWLGIPPEEQPPNHYRLLGLPLFEKDPDVIANVADQRMAHVRSFQTGKRGALSQQILNELSAARICLLHPEKKSKYDEKLAATAPPPPPAPASGPRTPVRPPTPQSTTHSAAKELSPQLLAACGCVAFGLITVLVIFASGFFETPNRSEPTALSLPQDSQPVETGQTSDTAEPRSDVANPTDAPPGNTQNEATPPQDDPPHRRPGPHTGATGRQASGPARPTRPTATTPKSPAPPAPTAARKPSTATGIARNPASRPAATRPTGSPTERHSPKTAKLVVPSRRELTRVQKEVESWLSKELKTARKNTDAKALLASELISLAAEAGQQPSQRFCLLGIAQRLATDAGEVSLVFQVADTREQLFNVDVWDNRTDALLQAKDTAKTPSSRKLVAQRGLDLIDRLLQVRRLDLARQVADAAYVAATSAEDQLLQKTIYDRREELKSLVQ